MKITTPLYARINVPIYRQSIFFVIDENVERVEKWFQKELKTTATLPPSLRSEGTNAGAFAFEKDGRLEFVIWMKWWAGNASAIGRLSHECAHSTIQILNHAGYTPRMKPRYSEPFCYLLDHIVRSCLLEIETWQRKESKKRGRKDRR
jgi:hypothetical protein